MAATTVNDPERFADMINPEHATVPKLGILGLELNDTVRAVLQTRFEHGVLVAAHAGRSSYLGDELQQGDIIYSINGKRIHSVSALRAELEGLKPDDPIVLQVERTGILAFIILETNT